MKRALVLSLICVLGFAFTSLAASLTGSWDTDITILPGQTEFNDAISIVSYLTVNYIIGDWTFTSITKLGDAGWLDQDFNASGVLGAFTISTALDLNPDATFGDLDVTVGVSIAGVSLGWDFNLDAAPDMTITASGTAGDVGVSVTLKFGDDDAICDFPWASADIDLTFGFCCVDLAIDIDFTCTAGFEDITFVFGGLVVPNLPWLTIDGSIMFDLSDGKTFKVSPSFDFGMDVCFDFYWSDDYDVYGNGFSIDDIQLDGIAITCEIGGVSFSGITYWGPAIVDTDYDYVADSFPGLLTPYGTQYFEAYQIATTDDACCGPFSFSLTVYFEEDLTDQLFDVDLFVAYVSLEVASQFVLDMGLSVDATDGFTEWTIGFLVTW
ncbi:hypothetical protein ACFLSZ_01600 [Candidatus Bipolaricaulota bacterium]